MNKVAKVLIYSAGVLALLGGTFGIVYGCSAKVRNWISGQKGGTSTSQTSSSAPASSSSAPTSETGKTSSSTSQAGTTTSTETPKTSSTPTSSSSENKETDYTPNLTLSNAELVVNAWAVDTAPTGTITASVAGSNLNTTDVVWESDNNTIVTVSPVVTKSGAPVTVTCKSYFSGTHTITARAVANLGVVKTCLISVDDHISWLKIKQVELKRDTGAIIHKTEQSSYSTAAKEYTYLENKLYFHNSSLYQSDSVATGWKTPQGAVSDPDSLRICASDGTYFCIGFDLSTAMKTENPAWFNRISKLDQTSYTYPALTTCAPTCSKITTTVGTVTSIIYFDMVIPTGFQGGEFVFYLDTKYYCVHFDKYVAPSAVNGVDPSVNVA